MKQLITTEPMLRKAKQLVDAGEEVRLYPEEMASAPYAELGAYDRALIAYTNARAVDNVIHIAESFRDVHSPEEVLVLSLLSPTPPVVMFRELRSRLVTAQELALGGFCIGDAMYYLRYVSVVLGL